MLKTRIVAVLVIKGGIVVQSVGFKRYLPIGSPAVAIEFLNNWGIDEIVCLDIDATREGRGPQFDAISTYTKHCQVPLAVGGGIKDLDDIRRTIYAGADKIVINTSAVKNPKLLSEGARQFGNQCIVASIDARRLATGKYEAFIEGGSQPAGDTPASLAKRFEECGAGEILLNSIDQDGSKKGYDLELIREVVSKVNIPVVVCGGVNHPRHFQDAACLEVSGLAAANFFHYYEHSVTTVKRYLKNTNANIRLDTYFDYHGFSFDDSGRLRKKDDALLEKLYVEFTPQEVI